MATGLEHILVTAIEECAEVSQRLTKALRFGLDEVQPVETGGDGVTANRARISYEVDDLLGVLELLGIEYGDPARITAKKVKVRRFMQYAHTQGTVSAAER